MFILFRVTIALPVSKRKIKITEKQDSRKFDKLQRLFLFVFFVSKKKKIIIKKFEIKQAI